MNRSFVSVFVERLISLQRNKEKDCGRESQAMKADMKNQQMAASSCEVPQYQDGETVIGGTMCHVDHPCKGLGNRGYPRLRSTRILTTSHRSSLLLLLPSQLYNTK